MASQKSESFSVSKFRSSEDWIFWTPIAIFLCIRGLCITKLLCEILVLLFKFMQLEGGILGSPIHSPHLWFIPSTHLDFLAIFIIPSPHLDIHTLTSPRVQIILPPHLDRHTLTSPRGFVIPKGGKLY